MFQHEGTAACVVGVVAVAGEVVQHYIVHFILETVRVLDLINMRRLS